MWCRKSGFSLMEMTVVLMVLSIVTAGGAHIYHKRDYSAKVRETEAKLDAIEKALTDFYYTHHRIPCPAQADLTEGNDNFAYEGQLPGVCTDGPPAAISLEADTTVMGTVPTRSLELPYDYLYDAWERRITYAVDVRATAMNAFIEYGASNTHIGAIEVQDANGNPRSDKAVYVLLSHGENGHGAYLRNGGTLNAESTNTQEQENANVDAAFAAARDSVFVMRGEYRNPVDFDDRFDDILRYRERWKMPAGSDLTKPTYSSYYGGPDLFIGHTSNTLDQPLVRGYYVTGGGLVEYSGTLFSPGSEPPMCVTGISFTENNTILAIGHDWEPWLTYYIWTDKGFKRLSDPGFKPEGTWQRVDWSPDGHYLAVASNTDPAVAIYKRDLKTNVLRHLTDGDGPNVINIESAYDVVWHPGGDFVAFAGGTSEGFAVYRRNGDAFIDIYNEDPSKICSIINGSFCDPDSGGCSFPACTNGAFPATLTRGVDWSSDGTLLAFAGNGEAASYIFQFNTTGTPYYMREEKRHSKTGTPGLSVKFANEGWTYLMESTGVPPNQGTGKWRLYEWDAAVDGGRYVFRSVAGDSALPLNCDPKAIYDFDFSEDDGYVSLGGYDQDNEYVGIMQPASDKISCISTPGIELNLEYTATEFAR